MKKKLLEYLVRHCVREVLEQTPLHDKDPLKDNPEDIEGEPKIPSDQEDDILSPAEDEKVADAPGSRGLYLINPRDKSKLQKVNLVHPSNPNIEIPDAQLLQRIRYIMRPIYGERIEVDISTLHIIKNILRSQINHTYYLYVANKEGVLSLLASPSRQIAKNSQVPYGSVTSAINLPAGRLFQPITAKIQQDATKLGSRSPSMSVQEADDDTKGAPAPPASGQGTAEQPEIPKEKDTTPEPPSKPETPSQPNLKGVVFVNPMDKSRLKKLPIKSIDNDGKINKIVYDEASRVVGRNVQISFSTINAIRGSIIKPNSSIYLYLTKDPESDMYFVMADSSLQGADISSVPLDQIYGSPTSQVAPSNFDPMSSEPDEFSQRMASQGKVRPEMPAEDPDTNDQVDERLKKMIKKMVNEVLDRGK